MKAPTRRLTRPAGAALNPEVQPLVENLEILNGARGNGMDRAVLLRDLVDLGYVNVTKGAGGKLKPSVPPGGGTTPGTPDDPTVEMPTAPTGVYASGGFTNILVVWDSPSYSGHAYAIIYRSQADNFSTAVEISTTQANLFSDQVGTGTTWYYWVRFVNKNDQRGPLQSTAGVKGETSADIGDILDQLKGQIDESFLTPDFNDRVDEIELTTKKNEDGIYELDGKVLDLNEQTTTLKAESDILAEAAMNAAEGVDAEGNERRKVTAEIRLVQKTLVTETGALAQQILTLTASVGDNKAEIEESKTAIIKLDQETGQALESITQRLDKQESDIDGNKASITTNSETIVKVGSKADKNEGEISSLAQQITTVESELGDTVAAVTTNSQTIAKINSDGSEAYEAQWSVKASIGDIQAGIGLTAKKNPDGTTVSQCTVIADQFSVGHIKTNGQGETIYPFIVTQDGVYMDTAYIKAATVQELVAGDVVADTIKASASITAPKIKGGTIEIGSRFKVDSGGNLTSNNAKMNNITANNGRLSNIRIDDTCVVDKIFANNIYGDIYKALVWQNNSTKSHIAYRGTPIEKTIFTFYIESVGPMARSLIIPKLAVDTQTIRIYEDGKKIAEFDTVSGEDYTEQVLVNITDSKNIGFQSRYDIRTYDYINPGSSISSKAIRYFAQTVVLSWFKSSKIVT